MNTHDYGCVRISTALLFIWFAVATSQIANEEDINQFLPILLGNCTTSSQDNDYHDLKENGCSCDKDCTRYGDCCHDYPSFNITEQIYAQETFECTQTVRHEGIYVQKKCPSNWNDEEIREKCENKNENDLDPLLVLPAISEDSRNVYRNFYCALCGGEKKVIFLDTQMQCQTDAARLKEYKKKRPDFTSVEDTLERYFNSCTNRGVKPTKSSFFRSCVPNLVESCPKDYPVALKFAVEMREKCAAYMSIVRSGSALYRNFFCAMCNDNSPHGLTLTPVRKEKSWSSDNEDYIDLISENSAEDSSASEEHIRVITKDDIMRLLSRRIVQNYLVEHD